MCLFVCVSLFLLHLSSHEIRKLLIKMFEALKSKLACSPSTGEELEKLIIITSFYVAVGSFSYSKRLFIYK